MKKVISLLITSLFILSILSIPSAPPTAAASDGFALFDGARVAGIYIYADDHPQILRAVEDFRTDIEAVTGVKPDALTAAPSGELAVVIGSIEKSPVIQGLIADGKLDEAKAIEGKWEAFVIKVVENPFAGMEKALVIAGSDKRGTVYGIYEMSKRIGVSPYYWWGDVPIKRQSSVVLPDGFAYSEDESSVKYRGIFINDEFNLWEWSAKFRNNTDSPGQLNSGAYGKIFELLLRLKLNSLWPAMHEQGDEFYKYTDEGPFAPGGVPLNAKLANDYGIVMGTSHCEPLLTCPADEEWNVWCQRNFGKYDAAGLPVYDYSINPQAVMAFWREHVEMTKDFEGIYNLGMRGRHDGWMGYAGLPNQNSIPDRTALLQRIIDDQRVMLSEVLGKPIEEIPQAFIPYKETATYYNSGLKVPDDVILMWADDNHGQPRQIPTDNERLRSGGSGVYYHLSYYGNPNSYLWISSTSNVHMYSELKRAYDTDSKSYWIVNVGDIKPAEVSLEFFAEMGRDINKYDDKNIGEYYDAICKRDYGVDSATAVEIAGIMDDFYQLAHAKRPEFMGLASTTNMPNFSRALYGDEAQIYINRMNDVFGRAKAVYDSLEPDRKDAFYEMIYYPIRAAKFMTEWVEYRRMNQLANTQGRFRSATAYQELSVYAFQMINSDLAYYNKVVAGGKWDGIMAPWTNGTRIPSIVRADALAYSNPPTANNSLGSVCEGQTSGTENVTLSFSSLTDDKRFIDVFTRNADPKDYTLTPSADFIVPAKTSGTVSIEERIWVSIDWSKLTAGVHTGTITVSGTGLTKTYNVSAEKFDLSETKYAGADYIMANGYVAIEAEHYSNNVKVGDDEWRVVKNWGRVGDSMRVFPHSTAKASRIDNNFQTRAARLEYNVYFSAAGTYEVTFYRNPTLNEGNYDDGTGKSLRTAISLNNAEPTTSSPDQLFRGIRAVYTAGSTDTYEAAWNRMVLQHCEKLTSQITVPSAGVHKVNIFKSDASVGFDRLVIAATGVAANSYFGPPESYNRKYEAYPAGLGILPDLESIPQNEVIGNARFTFGAVTNNYINVTNTRIYNGSNGFGWDQATTQQTATGGTGVVARDQQYQYGSEARTFTAKLAAEGEYIVAMTIGHRGTSTSRVLNNMSVSVNGETKLTGMDFPSGSAMERFFRVTLKGTTTLAITFTGSPWAITVIEVFSYREPEVYGTEGFFLGVNGTVYIEAETALEESEYAWIDPGNQGTTWTETAGMSGTAMFHGPNSNVRYNGSNQAAYDAACKLNYKVVFDQPGDYRVWVLRKPPSNNDDSIYIGLNGRYIGIDENDPTNQNGVYRWRNTGRNITITDVTRPYTFTIAGCEDGIVIDKIYLRKVSGSNGDTDWPCFQGAPMFRGDVDGVSRIILSAAPENGKATATLENIFVDDTPVTLIAAVYDKSNGRLVYVEVDDTLTSIRNKNLTKTFSFDMSQYPFTDYRVSVFAWEKDTYIPLSPSVTLFPAIVSITTNGSVTTGEEVRNLIDNNIVTKWYTGGALPLNVYIEFTEPVTIDSFRIGTANDAIERDPRLFTIGGSNVSGGASATYETFYTHDGTNLTTARQSLATFNLAQPVTYKYFRLQITARRSGSAGMQMSEFNLIGDFNRHLF